MQELINRMKEIEFMLNSQYLNDAILQDLKGELSTIEDQLNNREVA